VAHGDGGPDEAGEARVGVEDGVPSWTLLPGPMTTLSRSPRTTAANHMEAPSPTSTSPTT
jgi:hypothetical protein